VVEPVLIWYCSKRMSRNRTIPRWAPLLLLALFVAWVGVGSLHHHADNPTCQICKLVHSGSAELQRPVAIPTPTSSGERVALVFTAGHTDRPSHPPLGRGPPVA
jgi:hypothetical protein